MKQLPLGTIRTSSATVSPTDAFHFCENRNCVLIGGKIQRTVDKLETVSAGVHGGRFVGVTGLLQLGLEAGRHLLVRPQSRKIRGPFLANNLSANAGPAKRLMILSNEDFLGANVG